VQVRAGAAAGIAGTRQLVTDANPAAPRTATEPSGADTQSMVPSSCRMRNTGRLLLRPPVVPSFHYDATARRDNQRAFGHGDIHA
jgi:hypothetical protein